MRHLIGLIRHNHAVVIRETSTRRTAGNLIDKKANPDQKPKTESQSPKEMEIGKPI